MIPTNKNDTLLYLEEQIRIEYPPELLNGIYTFLKDIGLGSEVTGISKDELMERIVHIHDLVAIRNPQWPLSLPFTEVYPAFFSDYLYGKIQFRIRDVSGMIYAFNQWITTTDGLTKVTEAYFNKHPERRPKQLEPVAETPKSKGGIENWDNEEIERQIKTLMMIYKDDPDSIYAPNGSKGYISRLLDEARKRNLEVSFRY